MLNVIVIAECGGFYGEGPHQAYEGMCCLETDVEENNGTDVMKQKKQRCIDGEG